MKRETIKYTTIKYSTVIATAMIMTGCAGMVGESIGSGDKGRIMISADAEGMQAFGDMFSSAITNGKASPDQATAAWAFRGKQEATKAMKYTGYKTKGGK